MNFDQAMKKLAENLSEKRFRHSINVSNTAENLALVYGCNSEQAKLAGLLHDCARELTSNRLLSTAEAFGILVGDIELSQPVLLHAPIGAKLAMAEYAVTDPEIVQAITMHTTGGSNMSTLDKILFIADIIEPGRDFPGVDTLRTLAEENLDKALLAAYNQSIKFLVDRNSIIHPDTIAGRNELLNNR
ncbi:bis(5'-nucleosyl)-tetraphosphatase (symmetrical) YqeK [Dendrosporobacter sp. 1207_IL3150]|uniref:bis(5'-nucleosyl)-tetraphosphatase (symmetrical) YqeK n=1 Tax=Dendrosporobacter sp. 1207_IL3150 TaxID=3084054 RepID=UPI002FDB1AE8